MLVQVGRVDQKRESESGNEKQNLAMKSKLKLKLTSAELVALNRHVYLTLGSQPMEELRSCLQDYLICSTLKEVYAKTSKKVTSIEFFPSRRTDTIYPVTITQSQALALACTLYGSTPTTEGLELAKTDVLPFGNESYEANFLQTLLGTIHQTFII